PAHDALYWRFGPQKAIRKDNWTLVDWRDFEKKTNSGWQLFDVSKDIGQQEDLAARHADVVAKLSQAWERWNGGNIAPLWAGDLVLLAVLVGIVMAVDFALVIDLEAEDAGPAAVVEQLEGAVEKLWPKRGPWRRPGLGLGSGLRQVLRDQIQLRLADGLDMK